MSLKLVIDLTGKPVGNPLQTRLQPLPAWKSCSAVVSLHPLCTSAPQLGAGLKLAPEYLVQQCMAHLIPDQPDYAAPCMRRGRSADLVSSLQI